MGYNVAQKLIREHLVEGEMIPGREIGLRVDQTLTQDATGTLVMLELEAMGIDRAQPEIAVQYVDHNILQEDHKNPEDHLFLYSACRRYGIWFSRPGNGVSHPAHQERFSKPGKFLLGADSHTPAAGSMGMLAIGAGGLEVGLALAGHPFYVQMPRIWGVNLVGRLPDWTSAKDIILEMLRRYTVKGGVGRIIEYTGSGLEHLSAMDRHVIANMGAELGATTTVFPSDEMVKRFLASQDREEDWIELQADPDATYDMYAEIDLSQLEPLIAMPSSPDNVVPVREVAGEPIYQAYVGSSANPGYRDFAVAAEIVRGKCIHDQVSFDICPTTRQTLENLVHDSHILSLLHAGARLHQAGCNGCIGMGQAPATGKLSLRTVPRNFPGRSGTPDDRVCLVSPETAAASALTGTITDPRTLDMPYPRISEPEKPLLNTAQYMAPLPPEKARQEVLTRGANIVALPEFDPMSDVMRASVLLKVGDNISTDEILPAGAKVLPYRSSIPAISQFLFERIDPMYPQRAAAAREQGGHVIVGGRNYGQGSSREHAALAPRYLGLQAVIAKGFARIHWQNLTNFGVLPIVFDDESEYDRLDLQDIVQIVGLREQARNGARVVVENVTRQRQFDTHHDLSQRQIDVLLAGGLINAVKQRRVSRKQPVAVPSLREGSQ